jgi:hypothetical protein
VFPQGRKGGDWRPVVLFAGCIGQIKLEGSGDSPDGVAWGALQLRVSDLTSYSSDSHTNIGPSQT